MLGGPTFASRLQKCRCCCCFLSREFNIQPLRKRVPWPAHVRWWSACAPRTHTGRYCCCCLLRRKMVLYICVSTIRLQYDACRPRARFCVNKQTTPTYTQARLTAHGRVRIIGRGAVVVWSDTAPPKSLLLVCREIWLSRHLPSPGSAV